MATRKTPWPAGTPCWTDCAFEPEHRGMHHARDFYSKLFGWRMEEGAKETGGYTTCFKDDEPAAALLPKTEQDQPTAWVTYLATDDVDATVAKVRDAGGQVVAEPQDVLTFGRMALCVDPTGALFGVWQAGDHIGFGIVNEPDTVTWNDLMTRDLRAAKTFYASVFGYTYDERDDAYVTIQLPDGTVVGGMHQADQLDADTPANWLVHFAVADRDSSAQIAQELGAEILMTYDTPFGPEALLQGKHGEVFTVFSPATDAPAE
ncbi:VOC family protein [Flexivirga meconopsidis]|uniref:VOC family protein n=1 Tax=Flexivirga meconopsidis TaxID=2977121 RepID=UPI0022401373|nr:VOC family protein [Flexivirga meconopsidis]